MTVPIPAVSEPTGPIPVIRDEHQGPWRRHAPFALVLALAVALRVVAVIAYRGVLWFPDSHSYLAVAVHPWPYPARPQGYAFFLRLLEPFHSLTLVAALQHAMALAAGVLVYAVLRGRFGLPGWAATLCAVPVLFDGNQLEMEHMLLSDTLFWVLVLAAVALLLWRPYGYLGPAVAGLALGLAAVTRSLGLPLLVLAIGYLLARRRLRAVPVAVATCVLPLAAYAVWFHATWGTYATTNSDGIFLYSRTTAFANCRVVRPPASERPLCPMGGRARPSPNYIWHIGALGPLPTRVKFAPAMNARAQDFARRAILAQPGAYLVTGLRDLARAFSPVRTPYPTRYAAGLYRFPARMPPLTMGARPIPPIRLGTAVRAYTADPGATGLPVLSPGPVAFLRGYQQVVYVDGPLLGVILAAGGGIMLIRRRRAVQAVLPWACAVALLVIPPFTAAFDYRYVIPVVPLACLALGIAVARPRRVAGPGDDPGQAAAAGSSRPMAR